jgi:hypothetical protein
MGFQDTRVELGEALNSLSGSVSRKHDVIFLRRGNGAIGAIRIESPRGAGGGSATRFFVFLSNNPCALATCQ